MCIRDSSKIVATLPLYQTSLIIKEGKITGSETVLEILLEGVGLLEV